MKNIGMFSFIKSKPLKTSLNRYYKNWDWRIGPEQLQRENEWIEKWYEVLAQDGIYHSSLRDMEDPLSNITTYPYRGVILTRITALAWWRYNSSIILQEEVKGLITQIVEEIEKY
jgi:DNA modification methylase